MSRDSMAAAMAGRHPQLAGIAQFVQRDGAKVTFDIGWPELERDTLWAQRLIEVCGLAGGDHVLVTGRNAEGPWLNPLVDALRAGRITFSTAEPYGWDAKRSATFLSLLPINAVIGLSGESAQGLTADEQIVERLAKVPLIWARPDGVGPLREVGVEPATIAMLGPALAAECSPRSGLHLDPDEWRVERAIDGLTLTVVGDRAFARRDIALGVDGEVDPTPCRCGLPGPRVRLVY
ncbi:hypothetical protein K7711_41110 [Nocardia sp. CA2R105]|uniref:hypothetical protein n=1 Tax=Nocardia coffeae TaxID=2873381 RepID=UPI001CA62A79|nr:hypothetical protein [Nocardia coffeae]MBY8862929.1 hypothetical protein [Nocardia coffeae]